MIEDLRKKVPLEEFDYLILMDALKSYKKPRDKVTQLLKTGAIIRIKKGIYIFGKQYRKSPVSLEILANQIYGPSYISLEYALSYYGFIPERVEWVTSITSQKSKSFTTPLGNFSYRHIHKDKYIIGVENLQIGEKRYCMIASKEKALADLVAPLTELTTKEALLEHLLQSLRMEQSMLLKLDIDKLLAVHTVYKNARVTNLYQLLKELL